MVAVGRDREVKTLPFLRFASNQREREVNWNLVFRPSHTVMAYYRLNITFRTTSFLISKILFLAFPSFVQPIFSLQIKAFKMFANP